MKVMDIMVHDVKSCDPDTNLESVAMMMWNNDCGSIPVLNNEGNPVGLITDRDIAMASALNHKALWDITTKEVMNTRPVYTCRSGDDIKSAIKLMQTHHIRRLPVTDGTGHLEGILSVDDIIASSNKGTTDLSYDETMKTLKAVCKHH